MLQLLRTKIVKYLFLKFREHEYTTHQLSYLFWECTTRCNLSCIHCGSDCSKDSSHEDMPLSDFLSATDTIKTAKDEITVVLTGGEPLLRKDIEQCGREIRKRGMRWGMVSNACLYDKEKHISLLSAGLGALTFSFDGLEENHNWLRNSKNNFTQVDRAIDLAVSSRRLNFDVVTCVHQKNFSELPQIYDYIVRKGIKAWRLFTIFPIGRAIHNKDLILTPGLFKQLMDFIVAKRAEKRIDVKFSCEGYVGQYENKVRDGFFFCRAGINIGSVLIDGSISACPNNDRSFVQGNIYRDNFFDVWQNRFHDFRNRDWAKRGQCSNCMDFKLCQGNGLHNWQGLKENVLLCHKELIEKVNGDL